MRGQDQGLTSLTWGSRKRERAVFRRSARELRTVTKKGTWKLEPCDEAMFLSAPITIILAKGGSRVSAQARKIFA